MQVLSKAFDRDVCLFDVSATLALGPDRKEETEYCKRLRAEGFGEIERGLPLLARELKPYLGHCSRYELLFCKNHDQTIEGPAQVFIFSSRPSARWLAGTLIVLSAEENLVLPGADYRNHFIGVAR